MSHELGSQIPFDDTTPMPFGKYGPSAGRLKLKNVPPSYLLWLWDNGLKDEVRTNSDRGRLADYIKSAFDILQEKCDKMSLFDKYGRPRGGNGNHR